MIQEQIARRQKRASEEGFRIKNTGSGSVLSTFEVSKPEGKVYPVRIRSVIDRVNTCACPDYRTNLLGTCKHIEAVLLNLRTRKKRKVKDAAAIGPQVAHLSLVHDAEVRVSLVRPTKGIGGKVGALLDSFSTLMGSGRAGNCTRT
jgi:predicted nucleic acid-binding Zn finger protein